jgi:putative endonuclease
MARRHLEARGYAILGANYRTKRGEIDIVTEKDGVLVFVEVRSRSVPGFGTPEESITPEKRSRLVAAAEEYLMAAGVEEAEWRIDVVALELDSRGRLQRLNVIENAVEV